MNSKKYAVIGHPITHSVSPKLHEAGFQDMDIDASFEAIDIEPKNLKAWVKDVFKNEYQGAAVTIPHKETIREFLDGETEAAQKIGAVNTLFLKDGQVWGTNTDGLGALKAILTEIDPKDKSVLILGAGGASRAIVFALKTAGANIVIWNRTIARAEKLAEEFEVECAESLKAINPKHFDLIINTTSVGLKEWESVLSEDFWMEHHVAFDIVYDPLETKFLSDAEEAGATTITGDKMLVFQALEQFKLWYGIELEPEIMGSAFFKN